ncbi:mitochondrial 2-oxodicarboxylate carrier-like [Watersipora subatra]|uniref:mitochondrial 2-oxodicarboxylate carrier-like n=1 Tax=Watersipora subatra TaxID=2589382 RepID=UPI00355C426B
MASSSSATGSTEHSAVKLAFIQLASGGSAGLVEICLMHPLDVIKTRLQIQKSGSAEAYTSLAHCCRSMYKNEGFLSFYKGILPPILAETPKRATKFFTFEQYKSIFVALNLPLPYAFSFAGFLSGCTEAFVINPFEVVKVRLQSEKMQFSAQKNAFSTAREIIRTDGFGLKGLNKGLTATICRHGIWNACYFGFYHNVKAFLTKDGEVMGVPKRLLIGFTAGSLASAVNIPWDVAKSRIQGPQPDSSTIKYKATAQTIRLVAKEEGVAALYKGLLPKIMRLGPGGAIMLIVYEHMFDYLKLHL